MLPLVSQEKLDARSEDSYITLNKPTDCDYESTSHHHNRLNGNSQLVATHLYPDSGECDNEQLNNCCGICWTHLPILA